MDDDKRLLAVGRMVLGLIIAAVAGGISIATYANAGEEGGTYYVFWGAIAVGGFMFLSGLVSFLATLSDPFSSQSNWDHIPSSQVPGTRTRTQSPPMSRAEVRRIGRAMAMVRRKRREAEEDELIEGPLSRSQPSGSYSETDNAE
ncbi:MAG: hypothetical protein IH957_11680 [Chloroflexi bacterium]|nr:hypothetical protein [Chloroflexota bacterium]